MYCNHPVQIKPRQGPWWNPWLPRRRGSSPDPNHRACQPRPALKLERNLLARWSPLTEAENVPKLCHEDPAPSRTTATCRDLWQCSHIHYQITSNYYHIFTQRSCKGAFQQQGTGGQGAFFATAAEVISKMATWCQKWRYKHDAARILHSGKMVAVSLNGQGSSCW